MDEVPDYDSMRYQHRFLRNGRVVIGIEHLVKKQYGLFIPDKLLSPVGQMIDNNEHTFISAVSSESLPVLQYILDRSRELREKYGANWYPQFTYAELSKRTGMDMDRTKQCIDDLLGVVAVSSRLKDKFKYIHLFFLPSSRYAIADELIRQGLSQ